MYVAPLGTLFIKTYKKLYPSIWDSKKIIQSILKKENIAFLSNFKTIIHLTCIACRKACYHDMKNTSFKHAILWTKWSLLRMDLYYIILMKY